MSKGMSAALHRSPLVDEGLADLVWDAWDVGEVDDDTAVVAWALLVTRAQNSPHTPASSHVGTCSG